RRARARDHAGGARLDAAPEESPRRVGARRLQDQSRAAQPARLGAAHLRPAVEPARSRRAALCAQAGARARASYRLLPIDAVVWPPAGTSTGTATDPARALG